MSSSGAPTNPKDRLKALFASKNYELIGEVGRGGMGVVYLANDNKLDRKVALKTLSPDRASKENSLRRFEREAKTFGKIRHEHIAALYEFGEAGPLQYLALEYINGYDLESERKNGRKWKNEEAAEIIRAVSNALAYTHHKGILHRDIKPGNILIERATNRTVLTDFGLAKGKTDENLTAAGFAVGTPAYMAPEQISDQFEVEPDGRSDIFSLGTVFYEMLTNEHPFIGPDDLKTMRAIVQTPHKPIHEVEPSVPKTLSKIIDKMLEKHPEDRFSDAKDVEACLLRWIETGGEEDVMANGIPAMRDSNSRASGSGSGSKSFQVDAAPSASPSTSQAPVAAQQSNKKIIIIAALVCAAMLLIGLSLGKVLFAGGSSTTAETPSAQVE